MVFNWERAKDIKSAPSLWHGGLHIHHHQIGFGLYKTEKDPLFNLSYYSNPEVDSLILAAWRKESTFPKSQKIIKIQEVLLNDCVVIQ